MSSKNDNDTAPGGESSADYMISESGEQPEDKGKKSGVDTITDKIKEKVTGVGKSVKEGVAGSTGKDNVDDGATDLDSAQRRQRRIGDADSDPQTAGPTENLRQKAASTTTEDDSEEPA